MTEILEEAGYRVELWTVHKATKVWTSGGSHVNAVCLKRAQDPLDVATFSAAVSGWFYRTLMFRMKSREDRNCRASCGHPEAPWSGELEQIIPASEFILISGAYSRAAALRLAREALRTIATPPQVVEVEPLYDPDETPAEKPAEVAKPAEPARKPTPPGAGGGATELQGVGETLEGDAEAERRKVRPCDAPPRALRGLTGWAGGRPAKPPTAKDSR